MFADTPTESCICGKEVEDTRHFIFTCTLFATHIKQILAPNGEHPPKYIFLNYSILVKKQCCIVINIEKLFQKSKINSKWRPIAMAIIRKQKKVGVALGEKSQEPFIIFA